MVPSSNRREWESLLTDQRKVNLKSLSLQLKLASLKANIKIGKIDLSDAILELHDYCCKNEKMYVKDMEIIFGNG